MAECSGVREVQAKQGCMVAKLLGLRTDCETEQSWRHEYPILRQSSMQTELLQHSEAGQSEQHTPGEFARR